MKTLLLIMLFFLALFSTHSQSILYALNGTLSNSGLPLDGYNYRSYTLFDPETVFDQSSAGFDKTWDISGFTVLPGSKSYLNTDATSTEATEYPGTGMVTTGTMSPSGTVDSKAYTLGTLMGLTCYNDTSVTLNYNTDNVQFGSFPMAYGDLHLDNTIAGTYVFGAYTGTFVGTFITEVDAYGTMITGADGNVSVTRLKTIETLQMNYAGMENVGTFITTTYRYYRNQDLWPYLKSTTRAINIPSFSLNTSTTSIEKAPAVLSVPNLELDNSISVFPNPAADEVNITTTPGQTIVGITVIDILGKVITTQSETRKLDISNLQTGTYLI